MKKSRARQPDLFGKHPLEFGGGPTRGRRKTARPIATKRAMHVVLRSSRARGSWSLLNPEKRKVVDRAIKGAAQRFAVKIYDRANVGNHIHFVLKARTHDSYRAFIRYLSGRIAFEVTGAKKGRAMATAVQGKGDGAHSGFWDTIPYSRVLEWGRDFTNARIYVTKNLFEGEGVELLTPRGPRVFRIRDGTVRTEGG
ncbi:MAG: transposase [Deltaproteobacteria bacterium]|nr:transposase [Deltaproteobacteria bacterium]